MSAATNIAPCGPRIHSFPTKCVTGPSVDESWYAIFTVPRHEKTVLRYLHTRRIEAFLPTYEITRLWRNRQRVKLALPLFPCYLFVRINSLEYTTVRQSPGVIRLIGNHSGPLPVPDSAIELLRAHVANKKVQPWHELVMGKRVRVRTGPMQGVEGVLIRKNNVLRFVLKIELINQHAAIQMEADNLELIAG